MDRIKNLEDSVFEALSEHSPVAAAAAVHRAYAAFIRTRTDLVCEGELPADALQDLQRTAEIGRRIGETIRGMSVDYPERRKALRAPGLYVVEADGTQRKLEPRDMDS